MPQLWLFQADSLNNIRRQSGPEHAVGQDYGYEINTTVKWFASQNWYVHGTWLTRSPAKRPGCARRPSPRTGSVSCCSSGMRCETSAITKQSSTAGKGAFHGRSSQRHQGRGLAATAAASIANAADPVVAQEVPALGPYASPWGPPDPAIAGRQNIVPVPENFFVPGRFKDKTAIVTGCGAGHGAAAAIRLAREGANVVAVDWLADEGKAVVDAIVKDGGRPSSSRRHLRDGGLRCHGQGGPSTPTAALIAP